MTRSVLAVNVGSSSVKAALYRTSDDATLTLHAQADVTGIPKAMRFRTKDADGRVTADETLPAHPAHADHAGQERAFDRVHDWYAAETADAPLAAVGHRVVHGGPDFAEPVRIDDAVLARLNAYIPLAPSHQPHNLSAIQTLRAHAPDVPHVACFDTAFHQTQPWRAKTFALPRSYYDRGIRRYGFHGLSYDYIAETLPDMAGALPSRCVVAHLGHGVSLCALKDGQSVATTMGLTALDGLPMGKRSGAIDPGAVLHLIETEGMTPAAVADLLYKKSGLLGLSGESDDMADLLNSASDAAADAVAFFCYRVAQGIASLAVDLNGLDAVVFTAGIGENAAPVRAAVAGHLSWLGADLEPAANERGGPALHAAGSNVALWVIPTDEAAMIARHALRLAVTR
mgnify:CR=1 FL=1